MVIWWVQTYQGRIPRGGCVASPRREVQISRNDGQPIVCRLLSNSAIGRGSIGSTLATSGLLYTDGSVGTVVENRYTYEDRCAEDTGSLKFERDGMSIIVCLDRTDIDNVETLVLELRGERNTPDIDFVFPSGRSMALATSCQPSLLISRGKPSLSVVCRG